MSALGERREPREAAKIKPRDVRWAWRERFPAGMLSLVAGPPGSSKSVFSLMVAAELSRRGPVIVSGLEDPHEEVQVPRLIAAGADLDNAILWETRLADGLDVDELVGHVRGLGVLLVVLDPIAAHVPPTRAGLLPLTRAARETGCAILGVHHTVKGYAGRPAMEQIGGQTGGALGTARAVYVFGPNPDMPESERVLAPVKVNVGAPPRSLGFKLRERAVDGLRGRQPGLTLSSESSPYSADDVLNGTGTLDRAPAGARLAAAAEWVTRYLQAGARPVVELREDAGNLGVDARMVRAAGDAIGVVQDGAVDEMTWRLPDDHPWVT